ncbi:unnamed protein product [Cuscuta campestris]|uniref:Uncharacterized protein n=1 Tax=Cuscuta campestris TaxID=132261 RepID=A0A484NP68_9ASTE|nr:unnamed protein product [Cuscuta campestris]
MEEFMEHVGNFAVEMHVQVEELKSDSNALKAKFAELQGSLNHSDNSEIAAAERRKSELLTIKQSMEREMSLKHQFREQLRRQLANLLTYQKPT